MAKRGKRYKDAVKKAGEKESLNLSDAIEKAKENSYSNFTGSIDLHVSINVPKDTDPKSIRSAITLPNATGDQDKQIIVFTEDKADEAEKAGAVKAGLEDLIKAVKDGSIDFDVAIASPSVMPKIGQLGKILGPKGLMPSPKNGTVTEDIKSAVEEYLKGKSNFACDEGGVLHISLGKADMETEKLVENAKSFIEEVVKVVGKPRPIVLKSIHVSPSMGPSVPVELEN
ncbi:50S ribosomal protein L1 [Candidatus Dojkabacteria bacterium]|nr:50S ribosomal protein L1 [Candidatus Dojkabacteria bacterium]